MKNDHYFTENPRSPRNERTIRLLYRGRILKLTTSGGVFASEGLDPGTGLLVANLVLRGDERVLDLGCGWGPIGIAAALSLPTGSVLMTDVNKRAVDLARRNARDAGATNVEVRTGTLYLPAGEERFDVILSNPPYKAGRETVLNILTEAPRHLREGGSCSWWERGAKASSTTSISWRSTGPTSRCWRGAADTACSRPGGRLRTWRRWPVSWGPSP